MSLEVADLNFRLSKAEQDAKDASESLAKCQECETQREDKVQQLQTERDTAISEQQAAAASLAVRIIIYFQFTHVMSCWYHRVSNCEVRHLTEQPPLTTIIQKRRLTLFGHLFRMDESYRCCTSVLTFS